MRCEATENIVHAGLSNASLFVTTWHSDIALDLGGAVSAGSQGSTGGGSHGSGRGDEHGIAGWSTWDVAAWRLDGDDRPLRRLALSAETAGGEATVPDNAAGGERGEGSNAAWGALCEATPRWIASNATLWRTRVTGPEDPKLIAIPQLPTSRNVTLGATLPPGQSTAQPTGGDDRIRVIFDAMPRAASVGGCPHRPKYQMYTTTAGTLTSRTSGQYTAAGALLPCASDGVHEKNWISIVDGGELRFICNHACHPVLHLSPFHPRARRVLHLSSFHPRARLPGASWRLLALPGASDVFSLCLDRFVYSLFPHVVVTPRPRAGVCDSSERYLGAFGSAASDAMAALAALPGLALHGSGSAVTWDERHRLALFHTKNAGGGYVTLAYLMEAAPPYSVRVAPHPCRMPNTILPISRRASPVASPPRYLRILSTPVP